MRFATTAQADEALANMNNTECARSHDSRRTANAVAGSMVGRFGLTMLKTLELVVHLVGVGWVQEEATTHRQVEDTVAQVVKAEDILSTVMVAVVEVAINLSMVNRPNIASRANITRVKADQVPDNDHRREMTMIQTSEIPATTDIDEGERFAFSLCIKRYPDCCLSMHSMTWRRGHCRFRSA